MLKERQSRLYAKYHPTNEELRVLQEKLFSAKRERLLADNDVEILRKKLETLKLPVALTNVG